MPKVYDTRKQKAAELLRLVEQGPSFSHWNYAERKHPESTAKAHFKVWSESWVIPLVKELVPELRVKKP